MNTRDLRSRLEGQVLRTGLRTLSPREMASVGGCGPKINPGDDGPASTPSYVLVNGVLVPNDIVD